MAEIITLHSRKTITPAAVALHFAMSKSPYPPSLDDAAEMFSDHLQFWPAGALDEIADWCVWDERGLLTLNEQQFVEDMALSPCPPTERQAERLYNLYGRLLEPEGK